MTKFSIPFFIVTSIFSIAGQAGGRETGNGGNVHVATDGKVSFLDLVKSPSSVILEPDLHEGFQILNDLMKKESKLSVVTLFPLNSLAGEVSRSVIDEVLFSLDELNFYLVPGPLPIVDDKGTVVLPMDKNGKIVQLAIQHRWEKKVLVDRDLFAAMSARDAAAFFLHEALIRSNIRSRVWSELMSTEKIGNFVHVLFDESRQTLLRERVIARYLNDADFLAEKTYLPNYEAYVLNQYVKGKADPAHVCMTEPLVLFEKDGGVHHLIPKSPNGCFEFAGEAIDNGQIWQMVFSEVVDAHEYTVKLTVVFGMNHSKDMIEFSGGKAHFNLMGGFSQSDSWDYVLFHSINQKHKKNDMPTQ